MELRVVVTAINPPIGKVIKIVSEGLAMWDGESFAPFDLVDGRIVVSGADDLVIAKTSKIASCLSARVQGDDGEFYKEDGSSYNDEHCRI